MQLQRLLRPGPDTLPLEDYRTVSSISSISVGNDWVIYLPATKKSYYIYDGGDNGNKSMLVRLRR